MSNNVPVSIGGNEERPLPFIVAEKWNFPLANAMSENTRLYSIRDWISGLTGSPDPVDLWRAMKSKITISIRELPYTARDGKHYQMDFTNDEGLYKIAAYMRVTKGRNEALKQIKDYLGAAGAFTDVLRRDPVARAKVAATGDPEALIEAAIDQYRKAGRDDRWIQARIEGVVTRKQFTSALNAAVRYASPYLFSNSTNQMYKGLWDRTTAQLRGDLNLKPKDNVRDGFGELALIYTRLAERVAATRLEGEDDYVSEKVAMEIVHEAARLIHKQAQETSQALGIDLVTEKPLLQSRNK